MEWILGFIFLPTLLWLCTGEGKRKINTFAQNTLEEILDSLPEESSKKKS